MPLSTFATLKTTTEPRDLKKFQQLNAVRIQGVVPPGCRSIRRPGFLEDEAKKICLRASQLTTRANRASSGAEGSKFLGTFLLSGILIYLVLRRSSRASAIPSSFLRLGAAGYFGGAAVLVPGADDAEHIQPGGTDYAGWPGVEKRHPDRGIRKSSPGNRKGKAGCRSSEAAETRLRPILMTTAATVIGHFPLVFARVPGRERAIASASCWSAA